MVDKAETIKMRRRTRLGKKKMERGKCIKVAMAATAATRSEGQDRPKAHKSGEYESK
jgi:hypothetical protein